MDGSRTRLKTWIVAGEGCVGQPSMWSVIVRLLVGVTDGGPLRVGRARPRQRMMTKTEDVMRLKGRRWRQCGPWWLRRWRRPYDGVGVLVLVVVVVVDGKKDGCGNDGWMWLDIDRGLCDCMRFCGLCPESPMWNYL